MKRAKRIAVWMRKQVRAAGRRGIVVGLSGGIDSAVVAALAVQAVGRANVLGAIMPCESHSDDERCAREVAGWLGIRTSRIKLDGIYKAFLKVPIRGTAMAKANLKPRLRMCALYYLANSKDYLVAGTGNKSELTVGYFTKYGDGGVDMLPIGGLLKTEVRALAHKLGVPERIIRRKPSAGLWKDQTDEGEMGISYNDLDRIIRAIERGRFGGINRKKLSKVKRMAKAAIHKKVAIPMFRR